MISQGQLKRLGKRLRVGADHEDLARLNEYRRTFDRALLEAALRINHVLGPGEVPYLLSGRAKRTKSILRKLIREPTMDLSRMTDIVGLRIVVEGLEQQQLIRDALPNIIRVERIADYTGHDRLYRAIHVLGLIDAHRLEVQIRTLPQQVWADESEAFGEQAKEGELKEDQATYLEELRDAMHAIESGGEVRALITPLAAARRPIELGLAGMRESFRSVAAPTCGTPDCTLLAVFDEVLNELTRSTPYSMEERDQAVSEYERLMSALEQTRFSVLLLNTRSLKALKVTHPRFFRGAY